MNPCHQALMQGFALRHLRGGRYVPGPLPLSRVSRSARTGGFSCLDRHQHALPAAPAVKERLTSSHKTKKVLPRIDDTQDRGLLGIGMIVGTKGSRRDQSQRRLRTGMRSRCLLSRQQSAHVVEIVRSV